MKRRPKRVKLPSKVRAFADLKRLERMKPPELVATAKIIAAEHKRSTDAEAKAAMTKLILYIRELVKDKGQADA